MGKNKNKERHSGVIRGGGAERVNDAKHQQRCQVVKKRQAQQIVLRKKKACENVHEDVQYIL
jgi:uncharacterized protein (UPF0332 family)